MKKKAVEEAIVTTSSNGTRTVNLRLAIQRQIDSGMFEKLKKIKLPFVLPY